MDNGPGALPDVFSGSDAFPIAIPAQRLIVDDHVRFRAYGPARAIEHHVEFALRHLPEPGFRQPRKLFVDAVQACVDTDEESGGPRNVGLP